VRTQVEDCSSSWEVRTPQALPGPLRRVIGSLATTERYDAATGRGLGRSSARWRRPLPPRSYLPPSLCCCSQALCHA
jgi:hypothetical protein